MARLAVRIRLLALVTSAERVLLLAGPGDTFARLPQVADDDVATLAYVREHLDGEVSGLRMIAQVDLDCPHPAGKGVLVAARLVGHAPGRWHWRDDSQAPGSSAGGGFRVVESSLEALEVSLAPCPARDLLVPLAAGGHLLDLLLGIHAAARPPDHPHP